jgi:hypothetical protein
MDIKPSSWLTVIDDTDILGPSPRVLFDSLSAHEPEKFGWANKPPERRLKDTNANKPGNEILINRLPEPDFFLLFIFLIIDYPKFNINHWTTTWSVKEMSIFSCGFYFTFNYKTRQIFS